MSTRAATPRTIPAGVLGMILFIASEAMFFAGLFAAYFSVRADQPQWPPAGTPETTFVLPGLLTVGLLASSVTLHLAGRRTGRDDRKWFTITIGLGAAFVTGQAWEWSQLGREGLTVATSVYGTVFYLLTGAHGLHVIAGLVMLGATRARLDGEGSPARIEAVTYYWHFVDAVWLLVYSALYVSS